MDCDEFPDKWVLNYLDNEDAAEVTYFVDVNLSTLPITLERALEQFHLNVPEGASKIIPRT